MFSLLSSPCSGQTFWYLMRLLQPLCSWFRCTSPLASLAVNALTGTEISESLRKPFQDVRDGAAMRRGGSGPRRRTWVARRIPPRRAAIGSESQEPLRERRSRARVLVLEEHERIG